MGSPGKRLGPRPVRGSAHPGPASLAPSGPDSFKEGIQTRGHVDALGRVHCVSPLLYETGRIPFTLSMDNGRSFPRSGTWLAGEPLHANPGHGHQPPAPGPGPHGASPALIYAHLACQPCPAALAKPVPREALPTLGVGS